MNDKPTYTAFAGNRLIATGDIEAVLRSAKVCLDGGEQSTILLFDDETGEQIDFDFRGNEDEVVERLSEHPRFVRPPMEKRGPGRPRLGVVSREVTLLPRHWEWLEGQARGISGTLRFLVDEARKKAPDEARKRKMLEGAAKFMWAIAGDYPRFEDASRALFAQDFDESVVLFHNSIDG